MSGEEQTKPSEFLANHLARKGSSEVAKVQPSVVRAGELLASGEVQPYGEGENPFELPPTHGRSVRLDRMLRGESTSASKFETLF